MARPASSARRSMDGLAAALAGFQSALLLAAWAATTSAHAGAHPLPPLALAVWLLGGFLGAGDRSWFRGPLRSLCLAAGPPVALVAAGGLLLWPSGGSGAHLLQVLLALLAMAPAGLLCGDLMRRSGRPPVPALGGGLTAGFLAALGMPAAWSTPAAFVAAPLLLGAVTLSGRLVGAGEATEERPALAPRESIVAAAATALVVIAATAWSEVILLLCGAAADVRIMLPAAVVAAGTVGVLLARGRRVALLPALGLSLAAVLNLAAAAAVPGLASLALAARLGDVAPATTALLLACLTLVPLAGLAGAAWSAGAPPPRQLLRAHLLGGLCGVLLAAYLLEPLLGPARLLVFAAAALPLGAALPMLLAAPLVAASGARRGVAAVLLIAASLAGLFLRPAEDRLLAAGVGWTPFAFAYQERGALREALGERRVAAVRSGPAGMQAVLRTATDGRHRTWMGWDVDAAAHREGQVMAAVLPVLLAGEQRSATVVAADSGPLLAALEEAVPGLAVSGRDLLPALAADDEEGRVGDAPRVVSAWVDGSGYDVAVVQPLPPTAAASSLPWTYQAMRALRDALAEGGIAALRLPATGVDGAGLAGITATFMAAFPESSLWFDGDGLVLLGSRSARPLAMAELEKRFRQAAPLLRPAGVEDLPDLLARHLLGRPALMQLAAGAAPESRYRPRLQRAAAGDGWPTLLPRPVVEPVDLDALLPDLAAGEEARLGEAVERSRQATQWWLEMLAGARENPAEALAAGQAALALRPDNQALRRAAARLAHDLGRSALTAGLMADARVQAEFAVEGDPSAVLHHLLLYDVTLRTRPAQAAQRRLQSMATRFPDSYPVLLAQARHRLDQGEINAAEAFLKRAAATGFDSAALHLGLARIAFARNAAALGEAQVRQAMAMAPDPALVLVDIGGSLVATDRGRAGDYLRQARRMGRQDAVVTGPLGELALQDGRPQEAIELLAGAVEDAPERARYRLALGSALLLVGRQDEALDQLREARRLAPGDPMVRLNLAVALVQEGRPEAAREELAAIGDRLDDNPVYQRLRSELAVQESPAP